jgi:hypothetical protein
MHPNLLFDALLGELVVARQQELLDDAAVSHLRGTAVPRRWSPWAGAEAVARDGAGSGEAEAPHAPEKLGAA